MGCGDLNHFSTPGAVFQGVNATYAVAKSWSPFFNSAWVAELQPGWIINILCYHMEIQQGKHCSKAATKVTVAGEVYICLSLPTIMLCSIGGYVLEYYVHFTVKILEQTKKGFAGPDGDDIIHADYAICTLDHYAMLASQC